MPYWFIVYATKTVLYCYNCMYGRFADAETPRRVADGGVVFYDVHGELAHPPLDIFLHAYHSRLFHW